MITPEKKLRWRHLFWIRDPRILARSALSAQMFWKIVMKFGRSFGEPLQVLKPVWAVLIGYSALPGKKMIFKTILGSMLFIVRLTG